jgi:signal transduction histidine kinase
VELRGEPGSLSCAIDDDGSGFEPDAVSAGSGLANMRDRVESVGGRLSIETSGSGGARIRASLPVEGS